MILACYGFQYLWKQSPSSISTFICSLYDISVFKFSIYYTISYLFAYALFQIPIGLLIDRFGPYRILRYTSFTAIIGMFLYGIHIKLGFLSFAMIGRFITGASFSSLYNGIIRIIADRYKDDKRNMSRRIGYLSTTGLLSSVVGERILQYVVSIYGLKESVYFFSMCGILIFLIYIVRSLFIKTEFTSVKTNSINVCQLLKNKNFVLYGIYASICYICFIFTDAVGMKLLLDTYKYNVYDAVLLKNLILIGAMIGHIVCFYVSSRIGVYNTMFIWSLISIASVLFIISGLAPRYIIPILYILSGTNVGVVPLVMPIYMNGLEEVKSLVVAFVNTVQLFILQISTFITALMFNYSSNYYVIFFMPVILMIINLIISLRVKYASRKSSN